MRQLYGKQYRKEVMITNSLFQKNISDYLSPDLDKEVVVVVVAVEDTLAVVVAVAVGDTPCWDQLDSDLK